MQTLCAYFFEACELPQDEPQNSLAVLQAELHAWLKEKGATFSGADYGEFASKTLGAPIGTFQMRELNSEKGNFRELTMREPTASGQIFLTTIALVALNSRVIVYATLAVQNATELVAPIPTNPRCPGGVRRLVQARADWMFGGQPLPKATPKILSGRSEGEWLAAQITNSERSLPLIVIAEVDGHPIWQSFDEKIAADLAGLASVYRIDDEASWALSEEIGKTYSCYLGAVRLYWPQRGSGENSTPRSTVWTASQMLSQDSDGLGLQRITGTLRRTVMTVASLTIEPPVEIREIQNQVSRARLTELENRASANSDELELARLFIEENEQLKAKLDAVEREAARQAGKAEAAEYALDQYKAGRKDGIVEDVYPAESDAPKKGDVRFYKKTYSAPAYDILVEIQDCGHNCWQSSAGADKAKKGLERLLKRSDWTHVYHCGKCQGGGVWKVAW